jgi:hypothetical protein
MSISKKRFHDLIEELVCEHCEQRYCFLKKLVESLHPDPRLLVQLKCIEKLKFEESDHEGKDIGWNEAGIRWSDQGYAKAFQKEFDEELTVKEVYERTMARMGRR